MKTKNKKFQKGLQRLEALKYRERNMRQGETPIIAHAVLFTGLFNFLVFFLPGLLPDPLWSIFLPLITLPLNIFISIYALSEIKYRNSKGKELVFTGLFLNVLFLIIPFSFIINPPTF